MAPLTVYYNQSSANNYYNNELQKKFNLRTHSIN
jgi:hypothetical protein